MDWLVSLVWCRCQYLASAAQQLLLDNGAAAESFHVVCKPYTELQLGQDVHICCNLLVADLVDDGKGLGVGLLGGRAFLFRIERLCSERVLSEGILADRQSAELTQDVSVCCNLLVADLIDNGKGLGVGLLGGWASVFRV